MSNNDFDKPLNEWIDETIEVPSVEPVFDKKGKLQGLKRTTKEVTQRTRYSKLSDPQKIDCGNKKHDWYIPDKHNHVAKCRNCSKSRFIRAIFEKVINGQIINRDTGIQID